MLVQHRTFTPISPSTFDRSFEQLANSFFGTPQRSGPVVDGTWVNDEYVITVDLPGVPAEAVSVDVTGATLALAAKTDSFEWNRSLRLGGKLDADKVSARHVDGRLTVRIGTVDEPEARAVTIDTTRLVPVLDTSSTDESDRPDGQSSETNETE